MGQRAPVLSCGGPHWAEYHSPCASRARLVGLTHILSTVQQLGQLGHMPVRICWRPATCEVALIQLMALQQDTTLQRLGIPLLGLDILPFCPF